MIHALWAALDLHPNWAVFQVDVANAFNSVSRAAVFRELELAGGPLAQLIPFVWCFYGGSFPLIISYRRLRQHFCMQVVYTLDLDNKHVILVPVYKWLPSTPQTGGAYGLQSRSEKYPPKSISRDILTSAPQTTPL